MSARIVSLQDEYRRLETERSEAIESRQALGAQEAENKTVKAVRLPQLSSLTRQEFAKLTPNNNVYKQMGPVLVKQDQVEAKANVDKRLEFIAGEMCVTALIDQLIVSKRVEAKLKDLTERLDATRMELVKLSTEEQAKAQAQAA